tara:strand:- start:227 stop:1276 length:1050 start_codon:yes stop_codon:yes gene_type:complete
MATVLVTGGLGFVGLHTVYFLLVKGYRVLILDSLFNSDLKALNNLKLLLEKRNINYKDNLSFNLGDIRDNLLVSNLFKNSREKNRKIEAVLHFAGLKSVEDSIRNPLEYWDVNVNGTINLLKIMHENQCFKFVFSSSATIYSPGSISPIDENSLIDPINPYGQSKNVVEKFLEDLSKSNSDWRIFCLRYFNPIGAHESGLIGENPTKNADNLFPYICKVAKKEKDILNIFGNNWPTPDGTGIRDYIHVMDIAEAHEVALSKICNIEKNISKVNLGTGKGTSVLELINIFEKVNSLKIEFKIAQRRKGDIACCFADNKLAKDLLNWTPSRSIEDMCRDGWRWYNNSKIIN